MYSDEYASCFFEPAALHLPASPFSRNEGLRGQTPSSYEKRRHTYIQLSEKARHGVTCLPTRMYNSSV
jgi:hypothetical protein